MSDNEKVGASFQSIFGSAANLGIITLTIMTFCKMTFSRRVTFNIREPSKMTQSFNDTLYNYENIGTQYYTQYYMNILKKVVFCQWAKCQYAGCCGTSF